jgi:hypothetical protein
MLPDNRQHSMKLRPRKRVKTVQKARPLQRRAATGRLLSKNANLSSAASGWLSFTPSPEFNVAFVELWGIEEGRIAGYGHRALVLDFSSSRTIGDQVTAFMTISVKKFGEDSGTYSRIFSRIFYIKKGFHESLTKLLQELMIEQTSIPLTPMVRASILTDGQLRVALGRKTVDEVDRRVTSLSDSVTSDQADSDEVPRLPSCSIQ